MKHPQNLTYGLGCAIPFLLATACIVPDGAEPSVQIGARAASKFVHRGMTLVDRPVAQGDLAVGLESKDGGFITLAAEANMDLSNNTGQAWFPNGHAGRLTQIEFVLDYSRDIDIGGDAPLVVRTGIHSYNLPNGLEFPNGERGATTEVYGQLSLEVLGATPYLAHHYDFDEVRGAYLRAGVTENFPINDEWSIAVDASLGYNSSAQSAWMYGIDEAGVSDLRGTIELLYAWDERTDLVLGLHASTIIDSTLDDWFSELLIDDDVYWASLGTTWVF